MNPIVWQYIGIFSTALAVVLFALLLWRRRELRRTRALEVTSILDQWGFEQLARLLRAYTIGNYFGADSVTRVSREVINEILDGGLPSMLRKVGWKVVKGVFLNCKEDRAELAKLLASTAPTAADEPPPPTV